MTATPDSRTPDTRAKLLEAAEKLFARKGYDGASVKDLAEEAGVNVSLVSYHFGGKEGLLKACLEDFGKRPLEAARRMLQQPRSAEEFRLRLRMFLEEVLLCQVDHPDVTQILNRDCTLESTTVRDAFKSTFLKAFEQLVAFFEAAKESGLLREGTHPRIAATLTFGGLVHVMRQAHFNPSAAFTFKKPDDRAQLVDAIVGFSLHGCLAPGHGGTSP